MTLSTKKEAITQMKNSVQYASSTFFKFSSSLLLEYGRKYSFFECHKVTSSFSYAAGLFFPLLETEFMTFSAFNSFPLDSAFKAGPTLAEPVNSFSMSSLSGWIQPLLLARLYNKMKKIAYPIWKMLWISGYTAMSTKNSLSVPAVRWITTKAIWMFCIKVSIAIVFRMRDILNHGAKVTRWAIPNAADGKRGAI